MEGIQVYGPPPRPDVLAAIERDQQRERQRLVDRELARRRAEQELHTRAQRNTAGYDDELEHARQLVAQYGSIKAALAALLEGRVPGYTGHTTNGHHERGRLTKPLIEHSQHMGPVLGVR